MGDRGGIGSELKEDEAAKRYKGETVRRNREGRNIRRGSGHGEMAGMGTGHGVVERGGGGRGTPLIRER
jgi:hypothetical protein